MSVGPVVGGPCARACPVRGGGVDRRRRVGVWFSRGQGGDAFRSSVSRRRARLGDAYDGRRPFRFFALVLRVVRKKKSSVEICEANVGYFFCPTSVAVAYFFSSNYSSPVRGGGTRSQSDVCVRRIVRW